jgi:NTP pyrophosphatase (non-canonical NTP hydrolase)
MIFHPDLTKEFISSFTELSKMAHQNAAVKGFCKWADDHKHEPDSMVYLKLARLALIHSEVSECAEGVRKSSMDDHLTNRSTEVAELADVVIRCMNYAGAENLPLAEVILEKMIYNSNRPFMHGGKKA